MNSQSDFTLINTVKSAKITLLDIKRKTDITTKAIAQVAQLPVADVFVVETGGFSSWETAQKVVRAFNLLSGMQVKLEDIRLSKGSI
jgi:hypothetical protein